MPADEPALSRRDGVELIRTGSWAISSGRWTAGREDLASAVAAMSCPAIRRPVLKLGHTDTRFVGDGEPAIGWVEHLRLADGGHTLVGDYVGVPAWLDQIMASAYPDRSVEGSYNFRCQLGHTHPFALTAVALLGVTPPGVGTLRSLADVKSLYGLAAAAEPAPGEVRIAASVPGDVLRAAADAPSGAMVALIPSDADAQRLAVDGGEPVDQLHVTLMYLGDAVDIPPKAQARIIAAVSRAVAGLPPLEVDGFALSVFNPPGVTQGDGKQRDTCIVLGLSGDDLDIAHELVTDAVRYAATGSAVELPTQHAPWTPHVTLAYTDDLSQIADLADRAGRVTFDRVRVAFAGENTDLPLVGIDDYAWDPGYAEPVAAAAGDNKLKHYWTATAEGRSKWVDHAHPWTSLYRHLRKFVGAERAKRIASEWYHDVFGHWPGSKKGGVKAAMDGESMPNPDPTLTERIHAAWNASQPPEQQWIVEADAHEVIVMDNVDRSYVRVPVTVDGDRISFGEPERVRPAYVPESEPVAATRMVFASAEESRPDVDATQPEQPPADPPAVPPAPMDPPPRPVDEPLDEPVDEPPVTPPNLPAAEPEPVTEPKEEDSVSDLSEFRSRLGLDETADEQAILSALDELKTKADTPPPTPAPDPALVAASAAARDEMKSEISRLSQELATIKASAFADTKKAILDRGEHEGRTKPAERERWEARYDRDPELTTEIIASLAPNSAVPVAASGYIGDPDEGTDTDAEFEAIMARLDGPSATSSKGA